MGDFWDDEENITYSSGALLIVYDLVEVFIGLDEFEKYCWLICISLWLARLFQLKVIGLYGIGLDIWVRGALILSIWLDSVVKPFLS